MEIRYKSAEKENINSSNTAGIPKRRAVSRNSKHFDLAAENEAEERCNRESKDHHGRVVDEISRPFRSIPQKNSSSHIGEQAFIPISLEAMKITLNNRIKNFYRK